MENKYALLNYDMDRMEPTPDFLETQRMLDVIVNELAESVRRAEADLDLALVGECFYGNLHFGLIGVTRLTGNSIIDRAIKLAIEKIKMLKTRVYAKEAGIGDTATDECIAYELDRLLGATPSTHEVLLNRK